MTRRDVQIGSHVVSRFKVCFMHRTPCFRVVFLICLQLLIHYRKALMITVTYILRFESSSPNSIYRKCLLKKCLYFSVSFRKVAQWAAS
jgi:hypothetical protein